MRNSDNIWDKMQAVLNATIGHTCIASDVALFIGKQPICALNPNHLIDKCETREILNGLVLIIFCKQSPLMCEFTYTDNIFHKISFFIRMCYQITVLM